MSESPDARSLLSASSQLNLMEVDAIDDKEFDIPQVDTPPTLESILNELEDEEERFVLEDTCVLNTDNIDAHSCDTSSLASSDSGDPAHLKRKKRTVDLNATVHGSVLRHSLLKGISAQIVSAADKVDAGLPTAITVSGVIAVGTSHGLALVFDTNQALRLCLGTKATGAEFGAVSALSINHDCSRLLCGFAKGQITMWDLASGKLLRTITDAHPPGTAILHVKFTDDPTLAVCNDSGGSVFELAFRRVMGMRSCDSRCLFSGSKGEVCCIEPLRTPPDIRDHPVTHYSLLAMASLTKILVIGLKPSLKVWMTFPYSKSDPSSVPQLAWQFVPVQKTVNPILAFCKGDTVHFLLVKKEETGTIHVIKQRQLHLSCDIISVSWINSRTLVLVDSHEKLQVVDRPSQEILETLDLEQVQLVYNSRHFKSLATGGNVSQALALVGEKACYQSVSSYAGQIVYLGTKSAHIMTLRNWRERIDCLLKQEHFVEALSLAWSFHEGTAKAVVGLFGDPVKRKGVVGDKMVEILLQFAEHALKKCPEQGKIQVMEQHFHDVVPVLVDYCLLLQRTDLLFNQLYAQLVENVVAKGVFLESLESYIIVDRLGHLTTPIMRDLLAHYHDNGLMDSLERCIVHLDVTSLDIKQVIQVCWENQLYDAMIYVFNSGMNDYITPMEKLFAVIGPPLSEGRSLTDEEVVMGNKLLVYISCCLAGRAYPLGDIPEDLVVQVKNQVFEFLIRLHSADSSEEEEVFPFIHTLLHFDTREFLNVLAMTFEDFKNDKQALEYQQRIVDILLQVMVDNPDFTPSQVGGLFTFLARQLAKPDNTLFVNRKLFDQVLEFLCRPDDDSRHTERQQVLLELLQVGGVVQFDEGRLLALAEKAKFFQICEFLYEKKHLFDKIIDCYLRDPLRKWEIFSYIHNLLSMPSYSPEEKQTVKDKALQHIQELMTLDPSKSADLVMVHFAEEVQQIISKLQDDQLLFKFLSCLLESREGHPSWTILPLERDLHELLLDLLCRFASQQLLSFLRTSQHYRLEEAIQITQKYHHNEATAYLLEKKGDVHGAFTVLLETLKEKLSLLTAEANRGGEGGHRRQDEGEEKENESTLTRVEDSLNDIIVLCHQSSQNLDQPQREVLWFPLLETMMAPQKQVKGLNAKHTSEVLKELTMKVLNSMSSFISLPAIIQRILQDPVYGKGKLAEIQGLILGMLDTFNYEQTLLETTTNLLNHDLHWSLAHLRAAVTRGLHPRQDYCNICLQQYKRRQDSAEEIIVFSCGHPYHFQCLQQKDYGWGIASELQQRWSCYKCSSSQGGRGGPSTKPKRGCSTSLAQTRVTSVHHDAGVEAHRKKVFVEASLDLTQEQSWDQLRCLYRGPSRLSILSELSHCHGNEKTGLLISAQPGTESFQLKLSPPPLLEE
ncbi:vacuolar protein sorting-associated protein 8 homolog isoform X1 [Thunnus albacares]|uniref:vacuolar protein sorting-associated protein 8 homolog n=1 Tax=Thunnus maccoyii TaxID=8240 RepID=UPI001C4D0C15|nr:vacuolar protein sorting-associated protein 8 homolog [Thunnus maccoyii]XP_044229301.1 vacuolar protein sorting-associated protein 8 homolog isoform X1 [Thunnus albacares]